MAFSRLINFEKHLICSKIDNGGGIEWPNGFDFCPNCLGEIVLETEAVS